MMVFSRRSFVLFVLLFGAQVCAKQHVIREDNFFQNQGWPDVFWLKDFQVAVEQSLKNSIKVAQKKGFSQSQEEVSKEIDEIFDGKCVALGNIIDQLEHTGFECLSEFESETNGLNEWLRFLSGKIGELRKGCSRVLEKHYQATSDKRVWLVKPGRMQLELRRLFNDLFISFDRPWAGIVPDLVNFQTNPDHNLVMEKAASTAQTTMNNFLKFELPKLWERLDKVLQKDFRDAKKPESIKARVEFYSIAVRLSETARHFEFIDLCSLTEKDYNKIYMLVYRLGDAVVTKIKQLRYDEKDFSFYVQKSIWILMYWFYNIFPYKNLPWEDENCLKIENLFKQVSSRLNLEEPYLFRFNQKSRHKYKNPHKERG